MSSQDVIIYKVLLLIFYIILSAAVDISAFLLPQRIHICRRLCNKAFSFGYRGAGEGWRSTSAF